MSASNKCGECGKMIPVESPSGFCAERLLRLGLNEGCQKSEINGKRSEDGCQKEEDTAQRAKTTPPTEKSGDRIGRYRLLEEIGHGGCGVVYMAEQEQPVRRKVAIKVIKLGMDTLYSSLVV